MLRLVPLYPELLSIYADRGNVRVLERRAAWRDIEVEVAPLALGEDLDPERADVILLGGGQDRDEALVAQALLSQVPAIRSALDDGAALLAVCGGYQLLGHRYVDHAGNEIPGTGLVDLETRAGPDRLIGNVLVEVDWDGPHDLVGFENHAGRTTLGPSVEQLGRVIAGAGNDGRSGYEGCRSGRIVGTYVHGPLLPKNPWLADRLLAWGCERRGLAAQVEPLDDTLEERAAGVARAIARRERR